MLARTPDWVTDAYTWARLPVALAAVVTLASRSLRSFIRDTTRDGFDRLHHSVETMRQENTDQHAETGRRLEGVERATDDLTHTVSKMDHRVSSVEEHLRPRIEGNAR